MAHDKAEPEETTEPEPEPAPERTAEVTPEPEPGSEREAGPEPEQPGRSSGEWEDPPRPPNPSGFNPDYWPKY